ncbi:PQQ-dependent sugar dehydrogenase [Pseudochrobactrum sp. HB0163]|uniref:PQQ-dependent sugar dehydrogenase n=1 Tax=Pseudochrobactrum sp. HB0163 TaxID=3450708 RepID=UPI003F6DC9E4
MAPQAASARSINAGERHAVAENPFNVQEIAAFSTPWAIAVLPDQRLLITEKAGHIFLVDPSGEKTEVGNVPAVAFEGQNGLLDIAVSPDFATDRLVYFTYAEPERSGKDMVSSLVLARAYLSETNGKAALDDLTVLWRQLPKSKWGQPGGIIAFSPDGAHLFLTSGDRMNPETAQDPKLALGKVLRFNRDGSVPKDNPHADLAGQDADNARALTWTTGHRNPYGLAFAPDGKLWLHEMGPKGGDELNLIKQGPDKQVLNYGWPVVSNGDQYSGEPIPRHITRPEFEPPVVYWTPVIAPAGLAFYEGDLFPQWKGSALIGGLASMALVRVAFQDDGSADEAERYAMGNRIRDVAIAADGAVYVIEDDIPGRLLRLTPKQ